MSQTASKYRVPVVDLTTHIVEDRRAVVSPWSRGNSKLGPGIYAYSKLPGRIGGSCPGSTGWCELNCYAKRLVSNRWVWQLLTDNSARGDELPPLPEDAKIVRMHVSGDFNSVGYIESWIRLAESRPDVTFFGYTRSWRVPELLPALERLRALPNVFLWASMDGDTTEPVPDGWRAAWTSNSVRIFKVREHYRIGTRRAIVCPEEAGIKPNCESCKFCFKPHEMDLVFLEH